jgi:hypothetical protein
VRPAPARLAEIGAREAADGIDRHRAPASQCLEAVPAERWGRGITALPEKLLSIPLARLPRGEPGSIAIDFIEE